MADKTERSETAGTTDPAGASPPQTRHGRRASLEAGPLIAGVGGIVLFVSLWLEWFEPSLSAWSVFEVFDLVLALASLASVLLAAGLLRRWDDGGNRLLGIVAAVVLVIVVSQLIDNPPAAAGRDFGTGAWVALSGALLMAAGAAIAVLDISLSVGVREGSGTVGGEGRGPAGDTVARAEDPFPEESRETTRVREGADVDPAGPGEES